MRGKGRDGPGWARVEERERDTTDLMHREMGTHLLQRLDL